MTIIPLILKKNFNYLRTECDHIDDTFFMKFSSKDNIKIKQSDIEKIDRLIDNFALITKEFTFKTEIKRNLEKLIIKEFTR